MVVSVSPQVQAAMKAAGIDREGHTSGLYVFQPGWARRHNLLKFGHSTVIGSRFGTYHTAWPEAAGGMVLLAFLRVGERYVKSRETKMLALTAPGHGFTKSNARDDEWRTFHRKSDVGDALFDVMRATRQQTDGNFWIFDQGTGAILRHGGRAMHLGPAKDFGPNVTLRSDPFRRSVGYVLPAGGAVDPTAQGGLVTRRFRSVPRVAYGA
jgi:hypothetical protein